MMKKIVLNGTSNYTVSCPYREIDSVPESARRLTAAVKERTGAELCVASYDENGTLRGLWLACGWRKASYREDGTLADLYGAQGTRVAKYDKEGALASVYDVSNRRSKVMGQCKDGALSALCDAQGNPLADLDGEGKIVAVRHPASDVLTEEDEEYAERLALAQERLPLVQQMLEMAKETFSEVEALRAQILANRAAGREIAIVPMGNRPLTGEVYEGLPLTGYDVRFEGETLKVRFYAELLLQEALAALLETVEEGNDTWELADDYAASAVDTRISATLPEFKTASGVLLGVYYCGEDNFKIAMEGVTTEEYEAYLSDLQTAGFAAYAENQIGESRFGTYTIADEKAGEAAVFTMHYPTLNRTQIVYGPRGYLPSIEPAALPEQPAQTFIAQPERARAWCGVVSPNVPGMCLVIRLADGSFIVVDGGTRDGKVITRKKIKGVWVDQPEIDSHDTENIYNFLCEHTPNGEKPRVAVWFMTHPHMDHTDLAIDFLDRYQGKVDVELAAFNMPDFDSVYSRNESPARHKSLFMPFREKITELYGAKTCILHAGQKMSLPGCELNVLYTQEDYYPGVFTTGNQLSCALLLKFADKTVTLLGDCDRPITQIIADAYGTALKSDIVQVAHHGANGGCIDVYKYTDPDDCIWAIDGYRLENNPWMTGTADGYIYNRYLQDQTIKKRRHHCCDTTVILDV